MQQKQILINPVMRWAIEPGYVGALLYLDGVGGVQTRIPEVDELLTLPFIVDPVTRRPRQVRVVRLVYQQQPGHTVVIPVVVPADSA